MAADTFQKKDKYPWQRLCMAPKEKIFTIQPQEESASLFRNKMSKGVCGIMCKFSFPQFIY